MQCQTFCSYVHVIVSGMSVTLLTFCSYILCMCHCVWNVSHTADSLLCSYICVIVSGMSHFLFISLHPEVIMYSG